MPLFLARPALRDGKWDPEGGHNGCGYWLPKGWQQTEADPTVVDRWEPGMALCAVMGHTVDGLDVDPRHGGEATAAKHAEHWPTSYGRQSTPSGGWHDLVAPLGMRSLDGALPGVDVKAGTEDGEGRGFLFLAPTRKRSKATGKVGEYAWTTPPNLDALALGLPDATGDWLAPPRAALAEVSVDVDRDPTADEIEAAEALLAQEVRRVRAAEPGARNETVASALYRVMRFVKTGCLDEEAAVAALEEAAPFGDGYTAAEFRASLDGARRKAPAEWPKLVVGTAADDFTVVDDQLAAELGLEVADAGDEVTPNPAGVRRALQDRVDRAEAARLFRLAQEGPLRPLVVYSQEEADLLPAAPPFRVDGLVPPNGFTGVIAQNKTGKTTFGLNLAYAVLTGEDFLGAFPVVPVDGSVAFLNYELDERTFHRWARERGITGSRFHGVHMRGRGSLLGRDREQLAAWLTAREVEMLIVDPFSRAAVGVEQNDASEVREWLVGLDDMARGAGVRDLVLTIHSGWDGTRSRGSSALEDHPDSKVYLQKQEAGGQLVRTMSAEGRDVDLAAGHLRLDGRVLTFVPGEAVRAEKEAVKAFAQDARATNCRDRVLDVLGRHPVGQGTGLSKRALQSAVGMDEHLTRGVVDQLVTEGVVVRTESSRGHYHWLNDNLADDGAGDQP